MNDETGYGLRMRIFSRIHRWVHGHDPDWYVDYISCTERCWTCENFG